MNEKCTRKKLIVTFSTLVVLGGILMVLWAVVNHAETAPKVKETIILPDSGFYSEEQLVSVEVPKDAKVYFTENYEEPDVHNGQQYTEPISLIPAEEEEIRVFRFKAYYEDGTESEVWTRTYFLGQDISSRFTTNVMHITGTYEDLFGDEKGIFSKGDLFEEFIKENPDAHFGNGVEANFNERGEDWEREVVFQYFDRNGQEIINQKAGIRIHGGASRMKNQKSFKLYARSEYDEQNKFEYHFLKNLTSAQDNAVVQDYKRLIVRSAGSDNGFAYLRSELVSELARQAGFPDVMCAVPVSVYVNGEYFGVYWLENAFDDEYFENMYGSIYEETLGVSYEQQGGRFVVLEGTDKEKEAEDADEENLPFVEAFNIEYNKLAGMDLTVEENYKELQEFMDVENYLQYFALQNYIGNWDWPSNNLKVYRYYEENGNYQDGTVFDGRYRYLLYDADWSMGLQLINGDYGFLYWEETLPRLLEEESPMFAALMERQDCRDYFISYTCDLINGVFAADNVAKTVNQMHESRAQELSHMLQDTDWSKEELWTWEVDEYGTYDYVLQSIEEINEFVQERPQGVFKDVVGQLSYTYEEIYTLYAYTSAKDSAILVNSKPAGKDFTGIYFGSIPVIMQPQLARNEEFECWLVNDVVCTDELLELTMEDVMDAQIRVEMVVRDADEPVLQISSLRAKDRGDYVEISNLSNQSISTAGYYLSDDEDAYKYRLPVMNLGAGESCRLYGKNCKDVEALGELSLNFNLKQGEMLSLTKNKENLQIVKIPDLSEGSVYQMIYSSGEFVEILE